MRNIRLCLLGLGIALLLGFAVKLCWQPLALFYLNYQLEHQGVRIEQAEWQGLRGRALLLNSAKGKLQNTNHQAKFELNDISISLTRHWLLFPSIANLDIDQMDLSWQSKPASNPYQLSPLFEHLKIFEYLRVEHLSAKPMRLQNPNEQAPLAPEAIIESGLSAGYATASLLSLIQQNFASTHMNIAKLSLNQTSQAKEAVQCDCTFTQVIYSEKETEQTLKGQWKIKNQPLIAQLKTKGALITLNLSDPEQPSQLTFSIQPHEKHPDSHFAVKASTRLAKGLLAYDESYQIKGDLFFVKSNNSSQSHVLNEAHMSFRYLAHDKVANKKVASNRAVNNKTANRNLAETSQIIGRFNFDPSGISISTEKDFHISIPFSHLANFKYFPASIGLPANTLAASDGQLKIAGEHLKWRSELEPSKNKLQWQLSSDSAAKWTWQTLKAPQKQWSVRSNKFALTNNSEAAPYLSLHMDGQFLNIPDSKILSKQPFSLAWRAQEDQQNFQFTLPNLASEGRVTSQIWVSDFAKNTEFLETSFTSSRLQKTLRQAIADQAPDKAQISKKYRASSWYSLIQSLPIKEANNPLPNNHEKHLILRWLNHDFSPFGKTRLSANIIKYVNQQIKFNLVGKSEHQVQINIRGTAAPVKDSVPAQIKTPPHKRTQPSLEKITVQHFSVQHKDSIIELNGPIELNTKRGNSPSGRFTLEHIPLQLALNQLGINEIDAQGNLYGLVSFAIKNQQLEIQRTYLNSANTPGLIKINSPQKDIAFKKFNAQLESASNGQLTLRMELDTDQNKINLVKKELVNPIRNGYTHLRDWLEPLLQRIAENY